MYWYRAIYPTCSKIHPTKTMKVVFIFLLLPLLSTMCLGRMLSPFPMSCGTGYININKQCRMSCSTKGGKHPTLCPPENVCVIHDFGNPYRSVANQGSCVKLYLTGRRKMEVCEEIPSTRYRRDRDYWVCWSRRENDFTTICEYNRRYR